MEGELFHADGLTDMMMLTVKVKVKWSRYTPGVAQRVGRGTALLFHGRGTRRWWVVRSTPRPHFTQGKTRYTAPAPGLSGQAENLVCKGIRSRTFQLVFSHYNDWAIRPTKLIVSSRNSVRTPIYTKYCVTSMLNQVSTVLIHVRREPGSILRLGTRDPNRDFDIN